MIIQEKFHFTMYGESSPMGHAEVISLLKLDLRKLDRGKFLPGYIRHPVICTGRLMDFFSSISKVRQSGTLLASEKNSARTTLCTTTSEGTDEE